jgi:acetyl esterase/lipase
MRTILASCILLMIAASSAHRTRFEFSSSVFGLTKIGLGLDVTEPSTQYDQACSHLSLWRGLKYTDNGQNVLDVATSSQGSSRPRPVLLFVAGESFTNDGTSLDWMMRQKAICLSARNGMVGVSMSYRRAPAHRWPAGALDVGAAISWVHENIDLFGGDPHAIIVIGYSAGAFHVATFLAHKELQVSGSDVAGVVLISGMYNSEADAHKGERAYLGTDTSLYKVRSAFPGIFRVEEPIVLAWSTLDSSSLISQAENLKSRLCDAGHCPRIAVLTDRDSPASVFGLDAGDKTLADQMRELVDEIEARGLP